MSEDESLSRRHVLRLGAGGFLAAGAAGTAPAAARAAQPAGAGFSFLVVNDTHYVDERCRAWLQAAVRQMREHPEQPEFCLLAGDLTEDGSEEDLAALKEVFRGLALPVYAVIGNHDYGPGDDRRAWDRLFPGRVNYQFEHRGWQFVGLDTSDGLRYQNTDVQPHTLRWLDENIPHLDRARPIVLFTHFPLGPGITYRPGNADAVLGRFREHNLRAVFSGHFHGATERRVGEVTLTTNRCCAISRNNHDGSKTKGYFLCTAREGQIRREFVEVRG